MIAANAQQIVDLRKQGKKPSSWVLVSFIGKVPHDDNGFDVFANADTRYDWRWVIGLDVIVFARKRLAVAEQLRAISNERPKSLSLWDVDEKLGATVHLDYPATHAEAHKRAMGKTLRIELDPWAPWQKNEFLGMGF